MFKGVYCPIITVFDSDRKIDYAAQGQLVERLIEHGIDGILFCGSIGEFISLSLEEKREFFKWAVEKVNRRVWVLAGTGGTNVRETVELTEYCKLIGVDGAVVISPYYFQLDERALYSYYASVAQTNLPIILYNFPDRTKISLSTELILKLAMDFKSVVGIKDTIDSMSHTRDLINTIIPARPDFSVLSGYDEYLIPNLLGGGSGVLSGLTNIAPGAFVEIREAFKLGDFKRLCELQVKLNGLMKVYSLANPFMTAIKYAVHTMLPDVGYLLREPFAPLTNEERDNIEELIRTINF